MIRVHDRNLEAARQVDAATQDLVPTCAPGTLPTDSKHLEAMFVFCTNNWRTYSGEKPTGKKLASIRKQVLSNVDGWPANWVHLKDAGTFQYSVVYDT